MNIDNEPKFGTFGIVMENKADGHEPVSMGPAESKNIQEALEQHRNMGYNEGWIAAVTYMERLFGHSFNEMKDYRR